MATWKNSQRAGSGRSAPRRILYRIVGVLALVCVGILLWAYSLLQPVRQGAGQMVGIDVQKGDTLQQVASVLESRGLIRNAWLFRVYVHFIGHGAPIQAGHYSFPRGSSISSILVALEEGNTLPSSVSVTIPEGFTVMQIANRLNDDGICSKQAFLQEEQHGSFDESFLHNLSKNPNIKYRLEGYLFPDTYDFVKGENPHEVIDAMLRNFSRHLDSGVMQQLTAQHLSLSTVVTEASLIEKEAKVESERPIIASVINNRLHVSPPMRLQIDATIQYILGHQDVVSDKDLQVNDPYNTYLHPGLPPGPIANPGMASIEAVLHPAKTNYFYYVVKNDGTGEHYFAQTYQQQLHNEVLSQQNLRAHSH